MATGGDHDPFFDDLSDIPDGSSAGTGFGWGEGLATESSLRDLSTRLFSAAFSRSRSGAPSPPIENPSEPRFEAPLYDIFCRCELPVRAADASPVRVFYNDVTVLGGFPTKPLLKVLHPDPSRDGELCTQAAASDWLRRQSLELQPHPDPSRDGELCTQDAASKWLRCQSLELQPHPDPSRDGELCTQRAASDWLHRQSLELQPHPDPSRSGELCTQGAASKWSHRQKRKAVAASSGAPETKQQKRLAAAAIKATGAVATGQH